MTPRFDNTYAALPRRFFTRIHPEPVPAPRTLRVNEALATQLRIDPAWLATDEGAQVVVGNRLLDGAEPIAMVYAGHQFGHFNPRLGDGRAHLLGELIDRDGRRVDLQLKGSGRTPYSRGGDGRAPLGPVLREYIVSEAMDALAIPTTRTLAVASTGAHVLRQEGPLPGGVLMRVAASHIRVGTFEYFASIGDVEALGLLLRHALQRHDPDLVDDPRPALALLGRAAQRQAERVAQWLCVGFIHGVMNTDNTLISGETIDYGPCAFLDAFDPDAVFSSIDHAGRYAYRQQPAVAQWNVACLARALLPLLDPSDPALLNAVQQVVDDVPALYTRAYHEGMARKLGLGAWRPDDAQLLRDLLDLMHRAAADYTLTLRRLTDLADPLTPPEAQVSAWPLPEALEPWLTRWRARLDEDDTPLPERAALMRAVNPALIPRNHLVEQALSAAVHDDDMAPFHALVDALAEPFDVRPDRARFISPPGPEQRVCVTFCGT